MSFSLDGRLVQPGETVREAMLRYDEQYERDERGAADPERVARLADAVIAKLGAPPHRSDRPEHTELVYDVVSVFIAPDEADVTVPYWESATSPAVIDQMLAATAALAEAGGFRFWDPQDEVEFTLGDRDHLMESLGVSMDTVRPALDFDDDDA